MSQSMPAIPSTRALRLQVAIGPESPDFGSWNWLGVDLANELSIDHDVTCFRRDIPKADVVIFFKFLPDLNTLHSLRQHACIIFCPVDIYGSAADIDTDVERLRCCDRIIVHCKRLIHYFQSYSPTTYLDHHLKYVIPTRRSPVTDGPLLWVGEQSNLQPMIAWLRDHFLPAELVILTNGHPESIGQVLSRFPIHWESWTHHNHLAWLQRCRAAFDIKGQDFRARHKPPAKTLDFLASGVPFAMSRPSSSVDHISSLGLDVPCPEDTDRWLSSGYAHECRDFGLLMTKSLSLNQLAERWCIVLNEVTRSRGISDLRSIVWQY